MSLEDEVEKLAGVGTTGMMPADTEQRLCKVYDRWKMFGDDSITALAFMLITELWKINPHSISYLCANTGDSDG